MSFLAKNVTRPRRLVANFVSALALKKWAKLRKIRLLKKNIFFIFNFSSALIKLKNIFLFLIFVGSYFKKSKISNDSFSISFEIFSSYEFLCNQFIS